jgi:hypothetical protein
MAKIVPMLTLLLCSAAGPGNAAPTAVALPVAGAASAMRSTAMRAEGGSAIANVSARIIRAAVVGEGRAAPAPLMVARRTTVSAADGSAVPALVYDFE